MFSNIRTSKASKEIVANLTHKLGLGTENIIARVAFAYSLAQEVKLDLKNIQDAGGKEYSQKVLFGDYTDFYIATLCIHYQIYNTDKEIPRYVKMHIDHGLELLNHEFQHNHNTTGFEFISNKVEVKP